MRILAPCSACVIASPPSETNPIIFYRGRIADAGYITIECKQGHTAPLICDERKHDLLFQSGCLAFLDGYEREAVASFAASAERLWEFYLRVIAISRKIDPTCFDAVWKQLSRQSERQLGAFMMTYVAEGMGAYDLRQSQIEFRNKVIHQGYIPTEKEVSDYGEYIFNQIRDVMKLLDESYKSAVDSEIARELSQIQARVPGGKPAARFKAHVALLPPGTNEAQAITDFPTFLGAMEKRLHSMKYGHFPDTPV